MANGSPRVRKTKSRLEKREQSKIIDSLAGNFYRQIDPRFKQRIMDSRMIQEDHNAVANLSEQFIHRQFNPNKFMEALGARDQDNEV